MINYNISRFLPLLQTMAVIPLFWITGFSQAQVATDLEQEGQRPPLFDFETGDLQGWKIIEGAFGKTLVTNRRSFHAGGKYKRQGGFHLSTLEVNGATSNDGFTGVIQSPSFTIDNEVLSFLVGGGRHDTTYVALYSDQGRELLRATGHNAEQMRWVTWDVSGHRGRKVYLRVVDQHKGGWGHITCDVFYLESRRRHRERITKLSRSSVDTTSQRLREQRQAKMLQDPRLTAPGQPRILRDEHLTAVEFPVGGIGTGGLLLDGTARRRAWQHDYNFTYTDIPDSFFAIRAQAPAQTPIVRALQTVAQGPFAPMSSLEMQGEFPFAQYRFIDKQLPVSVTMEVFNPLIPLDAKSSSIPCAIYRINVANPNDQPIAVSVMGAQQNIAGFVPSAPDSSNSFDSAFEPGTNVFRRVNPIVDRRHPSYGRNVNKIVQRPEALRLHLISQKSKDNRAYGSMALGLLGAGEDSGVAHWDAPESLCDDFSKDGRLDGPQQTAASPQGETYNGAVVRSFVLQPGEKHTVCFVLTWHFPNSLLGGIRSPNWSARAWGGGGWGGKGPMYANWWADANEVLDYVIEHYPQLDGQTRQFHRTFYETNLPYWLKDRIAGELAVLKSQTCFWTRDGYFGGWEGCGSTNGSCAGNCSHVWHYAQAHARLFPDIGKLMREQEFAVMRNDGGIPFRQPDNHEVALDAQCGIVLAAYREHLVSSDQTWLNRHYADIRKAMDFAISHWDADENGWLAGAQHTTLDCKLSGNSSWLGSMYVAALTAGERMAQLQNDMPRAKRYRRIALVAKRLHEKRLFNGEYYMQQPGEKPLSDYNNGCAVDQLLGQWWAWQLGLGDLYNKNRMKKSLGGLFRYNFRPSFHGIVQSPREFVAPDDAGMQVITWPHGDRPARATSYADEVMSGFEYAAAAAMLRAGLEKQALTVLMAADNRYDGRLRTGFRPGWGNMGYTGNPFGDDECGKFYSRSLSIWSVLLAAQGYHYDGPNGVLDFEPVWRPDDHRSFFTTAAGWGLFTQTRNDQRQRNTLRLDYGQLSLNALAVNTKQAIRSGDAQVLLDGKRVDAKVVFADGRAYVSWKHGLELNASSLLEIILPYRND